MKRNRTVFAITAVAMLLAACNRPQPTAVPTAAPTAAQATAVPAATTAAPTTAATAQPTRAAPTAVPTAAPSPTPRPLLNPILVDTAPAPGEAMPLDKPLTLTFDQAMDRASVESAFGILPGTPGKFDWKSDRVVVFTPSSPWKRDARYAVQLGTDAKSLGGMKLNKPQIYEFSTIGSFKVAQTVPSDKAFDVGADASITVLFNRPVVPLTGIAGQAGLPNPLTLEPAVEGKGEWLNTSTYVFRPGAPLAAGTTYRARVGDALKDTSGATLDGAYDWSFAIAAPTIKFVDLGRGARDVGLRQPISLTFSQKMDHASAEAAFKIAPAVAGTFRWADERPEQPDSGPSPLTPQQREQLAQNATRLGEVMAFVPSEDYKRATDYTIDLAAGAKAKVGDGRTQDAQKYRFRAVDNFGVASTQPRNGDAAYDSEVRQFSVQFAAPVAPESVLPNLRFEPAISLTSIFTYAEPNGTQFVINNLPLKPSTKYKAILGKDTKDAYGQALGKDVTVEFSTAPLRPAVVLGSNSTLGTIDAGQPARVQVAHRNISKLDFELSQLSLDEFYQLTGGQRAWQALRDFKAKPEQILRTWTEDLRGKPNEATTSIVNLDPNRAPLKPGVYLLTMTAPEIARRQQGYQPERQILVATKQHVALKMGDREALAWVTDLGTGKPAANQPVSFVDGSLKPVANATTGADGVAQVKQLAKAQRAYDAFYAVVGKPGDDGFGIGFGNWTDGIEPYQFGLSVDYPDEFNPQRYRTYLYTDRPIYRPGQMVNFKGVIRTDDDARYAVPANVTRVPVFVFSDRTARVVSMTVPVAANGTFSGSFVLANDAGTGYYQLDTRLPPGCKEGVDPAKSADPVCRSFQIPFQVAAYRKPEFEVALTTPRAEYAQGDTATAAIDARYFFGGSAQNARVEWFAMSRPYVFDRYTDKSDPFLGRYAFYNDDDNVYPWPPSPGIEEQIARGAGTTDAQGKFAINVPIDLSKRKSSQRISIDASVTDVNDQSVAVSTDVIAHKGPSYLGIATEDYIGVAGEPIKAHVIAVDTQGKPLAGQDAKATLYRREWKPAQVADRFGMLVPSYVPSDTKISEFALRTAADGKATAVFTPTTGGEYRLLVDNGSVNAATSVWVAEAGTMLPWRREENNRITLRSDKDRYAVGETAKVLVPSPFSGTVSALLSVERGKILQHKLIELKSNSDVLDIPITPDMAPNAYVAVVLAKGAANGRPEFRVGYADFNVDPAAFELNVEIKPDKATYLPRETATYDIRVTDKSGKPVAAELSLALVDKAVLALADPNSELPLTFFYSPRGLGVRTSDSLAVRADVADAAKLSQVGGMGGGGGGFAPDQFIREQFKDTAYWNAVVNTDADGRAQVKVQLPDNLTTWVLDARAITSDTRVGSATSSVVTAKPLLVRPVTPRFMTAGDALTLGAVVNNNTDAALDVDVALTGTGFSILSAPAVRVNVPARGSARADWNVVAGDAGLADTTFTARAGNLQDAAKPELGAGGIPILAYLSPESAATAGDIGEAGSRLELIMLPPRVASDKSRLDVRVDTSLGQINAGAAKALRERPYDDNVTAAARVLAASATGAGQDVLARAAQKLLENQRDDGGWGWFKDGQQSSPVVSAYAYWALQTARKALPADLFGPAEPLTRARNYLAQQLGDANALTNRRAADEAAFLVYALAEGGAQPGQAAEALYKNRDKLGSSGKALLALTLNTLKRGDERIKGLLADLYGAASQSATGTFWQPTTGAPRHAFLGSNTRDTAIVLRALALLDPKNAQLPNVARWLSAARRGSFWEGAQDALWAVLGLDAFADATGEKTAGYEWRASVNNTKVLDGAASQPGSAATISGTLLSRDQANALVVERGAGDGRLYYTAQLQAPVPADQAKALERGIGITRKYERADCAPTPDKPCEAITSASLGKDVRVRLTVVAPNDLYFVRITDPLAAGVEPIDASLRVNRPLTAQSAGLPLGWWWFTHTELADDRASMFADYLPAGTHEFVYTVRPTIAGNFKVMPAHVTQSDFPETFGRSDGVMFTVAP